MQRVTAHPHVDPNGTVYNLGFDTSGGPMKYCIVGLKDGKIENSNIEASVQSRWKLNPGYMHSFGITDNYFILAETPMCFDVKKFLLRMNQEKTISNISFQCQFKIQKNNAFLKLCEVE